MTRDSHPTHLHMHTPRIADLFEDFTRTHLSPEEIHIPPHHAPINPEDEDDVVPDQHAAFGIQRATQKQREPAWRDFGLEELLRRGPGKGERVGDSLRGRRRGDGEGVTVAGGGGNGAVGGGGNGEGGMPR